LLDCMLAMSRAYI